MVEHDGAKRKRTDPPTDNGKTVVIEIDDCPHGLGPKGHCTICNGREARDKATQAEEGIIESTFCRQVEMRTRSVSRRHDWIVFMKPIMTDYAMQKIIQQELRGTS